MDPRDASREDGRAFAVTALELGPPLSLHPLYRIQLDWGARLTSTGLLKLLTLVPQEPGLRRFFVRWDNAQDREPDGQRVKVYLVQTDGEPDEAFQHEDRAFRRGRDGYWGHYPQRSSAPGGWTYVLDIRGRGSVRVFSGLLSLGMERHVRLGEPLEVAARFGTSATVVRPLPFFSPERGGFVPRLVELGDGDQPSRMVEGTDVFESEEAAREASGRLVLPS